MVMDPLFWLKELTPMGVPAKILLFSEWLKSVLGRSLLTVVVDPPPIVMRFC
jgi:hypothetical protein